MKFFIAKNIFPNEVLKTLYNSLIALYLNYGLLWWGKQCHEVEILQKKAISLITRSNYIAHTNPLFGHYQLLKIRDMFKLRLWKLYYFVITCYLLTLTGINK